MKWGKEEIIMRIVIVFVVALMIALIGAGVYGAIQNEKNAIPAGTIVEKYHRPERIESTTNAKTGHTSITRHPAIYRFQLRGEKDGVMVDYWTDVSEEDYFKYRIGDWYVRR